MNAIQLHVDYYLSDPIEPSKLRAGYVYNEAIPGIGQAMREVKDIPCDHCPLRARCLQPCENYGRYVKYGARWRQKLGASPKSD